MKKKSHLLIVLCLLMSVMLTACGGGSLSRSGAKSVNSASYEGAYDSYDADMAMTEEAYATSSSANGKANIEASREQVKLIYNGNLSFETVEYDVAEQNIKNCVEKYDGYFERFDVNTSQRYWDEWSNDTYRYADITVRVPAENFHNLMTDLQTDGTMAVVRQSVNVDDVSENYYDLEMRLEIAKASVKELEDLLEQAENVQDVIAVRQELSDAVYQVESLQGQLNSYDSKIAYSYLYISLEEVTALTMANRVSGYGNKLVESAKHGFFSGIDFAGNLILWLASNWLTLIIIVAIVVVIVKLMNRRRKKLGKVGYFERKRAMKKLAKEQALKDKQVNESHVNPDIMMEDKSGDSSDSVKSDDN